VRTRWRTVLVLVIFLSFFTFIRLAISICSTLAITRIISTCCKPAFQSESVSELVGGGVRVMG
jgi:hypothetical protein